SGCTVLGAGSSAPFWDIVMNGLGGIVGMTDDGDSGHYVFVEAGNAVNDGTPHKIVVVRTSSGLWLSRDGVLDSSTTPDAYSFGAFPPLTLGSDTCPTTTPLVGNGTLTDLCITTP
ncbi:MAG: hypothetical protein ACRELB_13065, partial [Polyangiaceae bacterium]